MNNKDFTVFESILNGIWMSNVWSVTEESSVVAGKDSFTAQEVLEMDAIQVPKRLFFTGSAFV